MQGSERLQYKIQVLRGIAVIDVVLFHSKESLFPNGYLGVDLFLVISGFLIVPKVMSIFSSKAINRKLQVIQFYQRRFYRLAPHS